MADNEMICYHGTSKENWQKIQKEGVLWGIPDIFNPSTIPIRRTFLSPDIEVAKAINEEVILEVEYNPKGVGSGIDNFGFNPPFSEYCWQFSVFVPINLNKVKTINPLKGVVI